MAGPIQMPSTPTSPKAFYIMWVVTLVLAVAVGVAIAYIVFKKPTEKQNLTEGTMAPTTSAQPSKPLPVQQREKVAGTVIKVDTSSITVKDDIFTGTNDKQNTLEYTATFNSSTVCKKVITKIDSSRTIKEYTSGSCGDITTGTFVLVIPNSNTLSPSFVASEIDYSQEKENPFGI